MGEFFVASSDFCNLVTVGSSLAQICVFVAVTPIVLRDLKRRSSQLTLPGESLANLSAGLAMLLPIALSHRDGPLRLGCF